MKKRVASFFLLILFQALAVTLSGILGGDKWYSIGVSVIGVAFNLLVSFNVGFGFLFGVVYAILNGLLAYHQQIYATFLFMIVLQAPMAVYSFFMWNKNKTNAVTVLKSMPKKGFFIMVFGMAAVAVCGYFLLVAFESRNVAFDTLFFVCSVSACLLLAFRYKIAYLVTLTSGISGVLLWTMQTITLGEGLSIAVFYGIVTINSVIAVYKNYNLSRFLLRKKLSQ